MKGRALCNSLDHSVPELQNHAEQIERSRQTGPTFLAAICHHLSQPLTALHGSLELGLRRRGSAAEYRTSLEDALEQADRLLRLIRSLQELAESENSDTVAENVLFSVLVREVTEDLGLLAKARGLSLSVQCEGDLYVSANSLRLQQAIFEVIGNAIEYSPARGTVRVSLSCSHGDACLTISDEGPGVPPEERDRLFDPFYRRRPTTQANEENGLGLVIPKRILEALGGTIQVESEVGQGTCFRIRLPLAKA